MPIMLAFIKLHKTHQGEEISVKVAEMVGSVESEPKIRVHLDSKVVNVDGFVGNFKTEIADGSVK